MVYKARSAGPPPLQPRVSVPATLAIGSFYRPHVSQDRLFHPACSHLPLYPVNSTHSSSLTPNLTSSGRPHTQASVIHSPSTTVLASGSCCDKHPQTWWLKTTCSFSSSSEGQRSDLSFTGLKSRCQQKWFLLGALRGESFSCLFQLPLCVAPSSTIKAHDSNLCFQVTWSSDSEIPAPTPS